MASKQVGLIERAYELVQSGEFEFVYQLEPQLIVDGYARVSVTFSDSRELRHALRDCIRDSLRNKTLGRKLAERRETASRHRTVR